MENKMENVFDLQLNKMDQFSTEYTRMTEKENSVNEDNVFEYSEELYNFYLSLVNRDNTLVKLTKGNKAARNSSTFKKLIGKLKSLIEDIDDRIYKVSKFYTSICYELHDTTSKVSKIPAIEYLKETQERLKKQLHEELLRKFP